MSITIETLALASPKPSSSLFMRRAHMASCALQSPSASLRFLRPNRVSVAASDLSLRGLDYGLLPLHPPGFRNRSIFSFEASHEESNYSEIEVEKDKSDLEKEAEASQEAWEQALASFKEQALKMQNVSQEAYELYSKKAIVILKETSWQLKIKAEKASQDLGVIAKEITEEGKGYLSTAVEKSPESVKDILETFVSSTDDVKEISKMQDFYIGIPYGILLSFGGFLSFMLTGSISAIRFGVILGGALLALGILSLRSWRSGESFPLALKGQTALASILFLRETRVLFQKPSFGSFIATLVNGVVVAFYLYRLTLDSEQKKGSNFEPGTEN